MTLAEKIELGKLQNRLTWYEEQIRNRTKALASIFIELRDDPQKPWRVSHESYEAYCQEVWGMTRRRLQQIAAGESVKALLALEAPELAGIVQAMPEGQMRELATAPQERRADVLRDAVSQPGKMTANKIKLAKARVIDVESSVAPTVEDLPQKANVCPHCHGTGRIE